MSTEAQEGLYLLVVEMLQPLAKKALGLLQRRPLKCLFSKASTDVGVRNEPKHLKTIS